MSYGKCDLFYSILKFFYLNQKDIYYPTSLDSKKYKPFLEKVNNENKFFLDDNIPEIEREKILHFEAFKETFYRKYDKENYILFAKENTFLEIIKKQIMNRALMKKDNISPVIIADILKIANTF